MFHRFVERAKHLLDMNSVQARATYLFCLGVLICFSHIRTEYFF